MKVGETISKDFTDKVSRHGLIEMVLTSLVNNNKILDDVIDDISNRFKLNLDRSKVENFLNTVSVDVNNSINFY